jgi:PAS domain-containing protein
LSHSRARQKGESTPLMYDYRGVRRNGEIIDVEVVASRIEYEGKSASLGFHRNVTDKKTLEKRLIDSEELRRNIFSSIDQGIAVFDSSLRCRDWNHQMRHFTGIGPETALGTRATKLLEKFKDYGALDKFENVLNGAKVSFGYLPYLHPLSRQMRLRVA